MKMKIKRLVVIFFLTLISLNAYAQTSNFDNKFVPVKDFIILKFDLFLKGSVNNLFKGGGLTHIAYQEINYNIKINEKDVFLISIDAIMDKKRYSSKKYYPSLKDCIQVRNKLITNKFGYSFIKQKFNNLVNNETLSNSISENVLNISSLDTVLKKKIINETKIKISILHPKFEKSLSCDGKLIESVLKKSN